MDNGFALTIRTERRARDMSQVAFADFVGCSLATLKRWESGQSAPRVAQMEQVLRTLTTGQIGDPPRTGFHAGWWMRLARESKQLSIRDAARIAQVSPAAWHRYEAGVSRIGAKQGIALAKQIGQSAPDNSEDVPTKALHLGLTTPMLAVNRLMGTLLTEQPPYRSREWTLAHAILGRLLVGVGQYDLGGQAFEEALSGQQTWTKELDLDWSNIRLSTAWRGFNAHQPSRNSLQRHRWLEGQLARLPEAVRSGYCMPRCILAESAGQIGGLGEIIAGVQDETEHQLLHSWHQAKYGDARTALRVVEPLLCSANVHARFAAHKAALEATVFLRDWTGAREHYLTLRRMESETGIRLVRIPKGFESKLAHF